MGSRTRTVWLRSNTRVCGVLLIPAGALVLVGGLLLLAGGWWKMVGLTFTVLGFGGAGFILREMLTPRLACDGKNLLVFAQSTKPTKVPLQVVEVFFRGQGPSRLPQPAGLPLVNSTVVVRLAESASDWHKRDTNRRLADWCEGYITLRGVWCEPINTETIRRLNNTLVETKRAIKTELPGAIS